MESIKDILKKLLNGKISLTDAEILLKANLIESVGDLAKLDIFRKTRTGVPEVIYAQKKPVEILLKIVKSYVETNKFAIISKYNNIQKEELVKIFEKHFKYHLEVNDLAKIIIIKEKEFKFEKRGGIIGIITAGSSDIPVAEEAKVIANCMGCETITSYDVGIAGLHRIFEPLSEMIKKGVHIIIVCAGMEGTLPGVVASLVDIPVIGVPISSGYGLGERGKGALTTMLQSCSPGLVVVNIDNGFGAGVAASLIANQIAKK